MTEPHACSRCGTPLPHGARFCSRCGFDVSGVQGGLATEKMAAPVTAEEDPQAGIIDELRRATIGEYDIAAELGRGGMATVYLAHEIALERKVAIKVMAPSLLQSGKGMADRFKREARTAAALSHPHIIPVYGVRESGRLLFFIMKFVQGRSLDAIVKEHGALPIKMVQAILAQAGGALDYAHRHGIIHRDIKPANIMLDVDGWAVVTDFGIAKVTQSQGLTMTGATIGTPTYMSPEQCAAREITGATDQYSLGITAYEMLTGKVPFEADSVMSLMWQHFHEPPRPIIERRPDCPPDLAKAIERMLAKAPADRWPSLEEAIEAIGTPAHNDPIRQQMRALARGSDASRIATEHHTPMSPVPSALTPPGGTSAPTTPIPATPTAAAPPPAPPPPPPELPVTPVEPISPTAEIAQAPSTVTPPPRGRMPPPPPPPPPPIPARPRSSARRSTGSMPAGRGPRLEPAPVIPAPFTPVRKSGLMGVVWPVLALAIIGGVVWSVFGNRAPREPEAPPAGIAAPVASVTVEPSPAAVAVGQTVQLTVTLKDPGGKPLTGRPVAWTSTDSSMARVSGTGLVTAVRPGYVTVTAESQGRSGVGTVMVTATAAPVNRVELSPASADIALGDTGVLSAAAKDERGNTLFGHAMTWSSSDRRVATVSATGRVTALRLGTATVTVAVEGKRDSARITVTPPAVAMVVIAPPTAALQIGGRTQLSATARDAHDRPIQGRRVEWRSSDPTVASVTATGAVTGLRGGQASITALIETQSASAAVTVSAVPVASILLTPATLNLAVGKSAQLSATPRDARGGALRDRDLQWSSSNPAVAMVSATGQVSAVGSGTASITATSEGVTASAAITVPNPPVVATNNAPPAPPANKPVDSQPASVPAAAAQPAPSDAAAAARLLPRHDLATGSTHSCGITQTGAAVCWGNNAAGQLGNAAAGSQSATPAAVEVSGGLTQLVAGGDFSCGLTAAGAAVCWGQNSRGQLGNGKAGGNPAPGAVVGGHSFTRLTAGARHACGLGSDAVAWCWGDNGSGQLGTGNTRGMATPQKVSGGLKFSAIAAGGQHTCGITDAGRIYCWGDGFSGQLGRGGRETLNEPGPVDASARFVAIAAGSNHSCALAQGGKVYCWGANVAGEIGDGSRSERDGPVLVKWTGAFSAIAAGTDYSCALTDAGEAYCWGRNREGQLGAGAGPDRQVPVKVVTDQPLQSISAGGGHSCGVTRDQRVVCWGGNAHGQLGDGTQTGRPRPAPVQAQ